jgi:hypothetical protein
MLPSSSASTSAASSWRILGCSLTSSSREGASGFSSDRRRVPGLLIPFLLSIFKAVLPLPGGFAMTGVFSKGDGDDDSTMGTVDTKLRFMFYCTTSGIYERARRVGSRTAAEMDHQSYIRRT